MLSIELILTTGSKAGTPAPIQRGYYMIGRHAECQIRPKSRSVSRRHCLLFHNEHDLRILDLQSTQGTRINEQRIEPKKWIPLQDGDQIRCGKICFDVAIKQAAPVGVGEKNTPPAATSEAWQEVDIAAFLEQEDNADQQRRYGQIRRLTGTTTQPSTAEGDLDTYVDTPVELDEEGDDPTPVESDQNEVAAGGRKKRKEKKGSDKERKIPKGKSRGPKKARTPIFSFSSGDGETLKLVGAALLAIALLGFLGYQIYNTAAGSKIQVIENID